ncbi:MAG: NAD(P)/FAD-dependent oxidoreductase [Opitutales bacterium]|nr:NAD(P)/FAD-dependent oxidoreductase [Opitutales bacterium]
MDKIKYDVAIIGAGLSGLSAALRLAMFDKKVLLLEKHFVVGGLNSFYAKGGKKFDVGLHALTNYPSEDSGKKSPLLKLCRQLRIPLDSLQLKEQSFSRITFPEKEIQFSNHFPSFLTEINEKFPKSSDAFGKLLKKMDEFPAYSVDAPELSTRGILKDSGIEPLLAEMLLCPTCYYGSAQHDDIDFPTFVMLFDAIFRQGLARPEQGIRAILDPLCQRLKELGVERRMNTGVSKFHVRDDQITEIELESGEYVIADQIISTCGVIETESLLSSDYQSESQSKTGDFTIIESISVMQGKPRDLNWKETVVFFNDSAKFDYVCPKDPVDLRSGVICIPENYNSANDPTDFKLRITHPANFSFWSSLSNEEYVNEKEKYEDLIFQNGLRYISNEQESKDEIASRILLRDTFTPKTIKRFTSHENGTLYGSPTKSRNGSTKLKNLFLAGTDQGYIGIVGAMLGGIAVANNQILRPA